MSEVTALGDAAPGQVFYAFFNTRDNTGAGSALSSGTVRAYKNGSTTESSAGLTLTTDFDGLTGLNLITIDTSADGTFYAAAADFTIMWAGTVNGIASTGNAAAAFSLSNRSVRDSSGVSTLLSRLSAARAGYLDNLSAGAVALEASLQALITTIGASAAGVATAVWANASRTLSAFAFSVTASSVTDKTGYALTSGERTSIANEVEAQIIDETDSEKVLTAITDKIAAVNPDLGGLTVAAIASAVWSAVTRTLTAGTNIVLAKGTGVTGFTDLDAAGVRTAVGLGTANLDTQLADLPTNAELATALAAADDAVLNAIAALSIPTASDNAAANLAAAYEGAETVQQGLRLMRAALVGKASGLATSTAKYRSKADDKDRITATVDEDGNRTAVTVDAA